MEKTLSVRIGTEDYEFVRKLAKDSNKDISEAVRNLVDLGRLMFAIESYKSKKASLGKSAELAGVSISEMMALLAEFGVESNIEMEDYAKGLENLRKVW